MLEDLLLPPTRDLRLAQITIGDAALTLTVIATAHQVNCPHCAHPSVSIHSHYTRHVADLPFAGVCIQLELQVRKFFCRNRECPRRIFTERLTPFISTYARQTTRLRNVLAHVGLRLGGEEGARLANKQSMPTSHDSLLRWTRTLTEAKVKTPRVLGVDDWAMRKGHTYGTLLVDLEAHQPIDLLPDREADTLATWLQQHPGVAIISRDRAGAYADGAPRGAPTAQQVADRFHLLQNLRDAVQRLMDRQQKVLSQVTETPSPTPAMPENPTKSGESSELTRPTETPAIPAVLTRVEERQQRSRARRQARYAKVHQLKQAGLSLRAMVRKLKMSRHTVARFLHTDTFPERARPSRRASLLNPYDPYLTAQMSTGHTNGMQLWRDIGIQGYKGSRSLVSRWVAHHRHLTPTMIAREKKPKVRGRPPCARPTTMANPPRALSARQAAWLVVRPPADLDDEQQEILKRLCQQSNEVQTIYPLVQEFAQIVRTRASPAFESWLLQVRASQVREMVSFANSLERDKAAVIAGLSLPYSNGQVEGQINRLKLIKRQMYGRANFDLLRKRVLYTDSS